MNADIVIDVSVFFKESGTAKLAEVERYKTEAIALAGDGNNVTVTGAAPVWLYLSVAHALHGKVRKLFYSSPATGEVSIFNHSSD